MTKTIVFIHGFMNNNKVWTDWKSFLRSEVTRCMHRHGLTWTGK